nr:M15 family metallopeptidase [Bacillus sp. AFS002410]
MKKINRKFVLLLMVLITIVGLALFITNQNSVNNEPQTNEAQRSPVFPNYNHTAIEAENGLLEVTNPKSDLVLVNKERKLPDGYGPPDLIYPIVPLHGVSKDKTLMRKEAGHALEKLFEKAESDGIELTPVSAYRSFERQKSLYNYYVQIHGEDWTQSFSAVPGTSEHQTGLAIDVSSPNFGNKLEQGFGKTKEGIWLAKHAHECGFVIRYPEDKAEMTGYDYEPWHIRYVGIKYATYLYKNNLVLEEVMKPNH